MFEVTYYDITGIKINMVANAVQLLHLLELYNAGEHVKALSADLYGKPIDCWKLINGLKFT